MPGGDEDPAQSAIRFEMHEIGEDGVAKEEKWTGSQWTNKSVQLLVKYDLLNGQDFDVEYSTKSSPRPDVTEDWQAYNKENGITLEANEVIYARLKEQVEPGQEAQYGDYATINITKMDKHAPEGLGIDNVSTTTNSVKVDAHEAIDPKEEGTSEQEPSSGVEGYYFRLDETGEWLTNPDDHKKRTYTFVNGQDGTATIATISDEPIMTMEAPSFDGMEVEQGSKHTVYVKVKDNAGNETADDAVKQENIIVKTIPGAGSNEQNITFEMTTKASGEEKPWHDTDNEWTKGPVTVKVNNSTTPDYGNLKLEYIYQKTGETTEQAPEEGWQDYNKDTGITDIVTNGTIWVRLKEEVPEGKPSQVGNPVKLKLKHIDSVQPEEFKVAPVITDVTTNSFKVQGTTTDGISSIKEYKYSYTEDAEAQESTLSWENETEGEDAGTHTFKNLKQGTVYYVRIKAIDQAGNERISTKVNIQTGIVTPLTLSDIEITYDPNDLYTQGPVYVSIKVKEEKNPQGYELQYAKENPYQEESWTKYSNRIEYRTNGPIYVRLYDGTNGGIFATGTVMSIDLLSPNDINDMRVTSNDSSSLTVTGNTIDQEDNGIYTKSDIEGYYFAIDKNDEQSFVKGNGNTYTFTGLKQKSTHTVYMKAKDKAGNWSNVAQKEGMVGSVPGRDDKNPNNPEESIITFKMTVDGEPWDKNWTNKEVKVEINHTAGEKYVLQTSLTGDESSWSLYNEETGIVMKGNGNIYARLKEKDGEQFGDAATLIINKIDTQAPNALETPIVKVTTNSITIDGIETTDKEDNGISGMSDIEGYYFDIDNKNEWKTNSDKKQTSYTFTGLLQGTEHIVKMKARDNAGNETDSVSVIKSTDKVPGGEDKNPDNPSESIITFKMKVNGEPWSAQKEEGKNWTNQDVTVEVNHTAGEDYVLETSRTAREDDWQSYTTGILMQQNGIIYARLKEANGIQTSQINATFNLELIDKELPELTALTLEPTTNSITASVDEVTDIGETGTTDASGIEGYYFNISSESPDTWYRSDIPSYTFTGLSQGTSYTIKLKIKDNAGNETKEPAMKEIVTSTIIGKEDLKEKLTFTAKIGTEIWNQDTWINDEEINIGLKVEVNLNDEELSKIFELQTKSSENDNWETYPVNGVTMTGNGTVYARLKERNGTQVGIETTFDITHVDKLPPEELNQPQIEKTTRSATITATSVKDQVDTSGKNGTSGIEGYYFKFDQNNWEKIEGNELTKMYDNLAQGSTHTLQIKVKDNAKNETILDANPIIIDSIPIISSENIKDNIEFSYIPSDEFTQGPVTIILTNKNPEIEKFIMQYSYTGEDDYEDYPKEGITNVTTNKKNVYVRLTDGYNKTQGVIVGNVTSIDLSPPKNFEIEATTTTNSITVTVPTPTEDAPQTDDYACSGNIKYFYSIDNGSHWYPENGTSSTSFKFGSSEQDTQNSKKETIIQGKLYDQIRVKAEDKVKNYVLSTNTVQVSTSTVPGLTKDNINFTYTPSDNFTQGPVTVTMEVGESVTNKNEFTLEYAKENPDQETNWKIYNPSADPIIYETNGSIYARLVDTSKQYTGYATGNIVSIDKLEPLAFTPTVDESYVTATSIRVDASTTDDTSQSNLYTHSEETNLKYQFNCSNDPDKWFPETPSTQKYYTFSGLQPNIEYTFKAKAIDEAGNVYTTDSSHEIKHKTLGEFLLTVSANPSAGGTVRINGGSSSANIIVGTSTTVTASTQTGYDFLGWYEGTSLVNSSMSYTFSMPPKAYSLTAKFKLQTRTITYHATTRSSSATKTLTVDYGTYHYLESCSWSAPSSGYSFDVWSYYKDGYNYTGYAGNSFKVTSNVDIYATWCCTRTAKKCPYAMYLKNPSTHWLLVSDTASYTCPTHRAYNSSTGYYTYPAVLNYISNSFGYIKCAACSWSVSRGYKTSTTHTCCGCGQSILWSNYNNTCSLSRLGYYRVEWYNCNKHFSQLGLSLWDWRYYTYDSTYRY